MPFNHNYDHHAAHFHFFRRIPGLKALYLNMVLRNFGLSLFGIFVPIYIFQNLQKQLGLSFPQAFAGVFGYFFVIKIFLLLANIPAAYFVQNKGFRRSIFLSSIILLSQRLCLLLAAKSFLFFFPAAALTGILVPFYWLPHHLIFVEDGNPEAYGRQISIGGFLVRLFSALAPFIGGFLIFQFGFNLVIVLSFAVLLFSSFPTAFMNHHKIHYVPSIKKLKTVFAEAKFSHLALWGAGMSDTANTIVWPIFVYISIVNFQSLGMITSSALIISLLVVLLAGAVTDKVSHKNFLNKGIIAVSLINFIKFLPKTIWQFLIVDIGFKTAFPFFYIPFDTLVYEKALKKGSFAFLINREFSLNTGRLMMCGLGAVMALLKAPFWMFFAMSAGFVLLTRLIMKEKNIEGSKASNSKHQTPNKSQAPNNKSQ